jgi:ArsR family transcriptional regulator
MTRASVPVFLDLFLYFGNSRIMEIRTATLLFQALAQEKRLKAFRLLIEAGKPGKVAGDIARSLGVPASTLSSHLAILELAGLIQSWRVQRSIYYAVVEEGIRDAIDFLTQDCCRGQPELCGFKAPRKKRTAKAKAAKLKTA